MTRGPNIYIDGVKVQNYNPNQQETSSNQAESTNTNAVQLLVQTGHAKEVAAPQEWTEGGELAPLPAPPMSPLLASDTTMTQQFRKSLKDAPSTTTELRNFVSNVWHTGIAYQINKFLGYSTSPKTHPSDYKKETISVDMDAINALGDLGAPITSINSENDTIDSSFNKGDVISATFYVPTPKALAKKAAAGFIQGVLFPIDATIVGIHALVDKSYRKNVVHGIESMPKQFFEDPFGDSVEFMTSLVGGSLAFEKVDWGLTKAKGYVRTRGLPEVKPEEIIENRVITGEKVFAEYPDNLLRANPKEKVAYLNKVNRRVKNAIESKAGIKSDTEYLGLHATDIEFPDETAVLKGSSESPGLYVAPEGSPYFLRLGVPASEPKTSSLSFNIRDLFKPRFMRNPTFIAVQTDRVEMFPRWISTRKQFNSYIWEQAGTGKNIITFESTFNGKPEMESIIPPGTILKKVSNGVRVKWQGVRVPVRIYKAMRARGKVKIPDDVDIIPKSSSSLGLETAPSGLYSSLGAISALGVFGASFEPTTSEEFERNEFFKASSTTTSFENMLISYKKSRNLSNSSDIISDFSDDSGISGFWDDGNGSISRGNGGSSSGGDNGESGSGGNGSNGGSSGSNRGGSSGGNGLPSEPPSNFSKSFANLSDISSPLSNQEIISLPPQPRYFRKGRSIQPLGGIMEIRWSKTNQWGDIKLGIESLKQQFKEIENMFGGKKSKKARSKRSSRKSKTKGASSWGMVGLF